MGNVHGYNSKNSSGLTFKNLADVSSQATLPRVGDTVRLTLKCVVNGSVQFTKQILLHWLEVGSMWYSIP